MRNTQHRNFRASGRHTAVNVVAPLSHARLADATSASVAERLPELSAGIEVQEEELEAVIAQRVYKMRCGCGRSWFELELKKFVTCPACRKLGLVTPDANSKAAL
jgi:hypothetical protein